MSRSGLMSFAGVMPEHRAVVVCEVSSAAALWLSARPGRPVVSVPAQQPQPDDRRVPVDLGGTDGLAKSR
jgi:hypothetical protein